MLWHDIQQRPRKLLYTPRPGSEGFTIVEVMIAIAIFTLGLLGLSSMQLTAIRINAAAQRTTQLSTVAHEQMEELLAQPYAAAVLADLDPAIGGATTYCVLYPPAGLQPCTAPVPPASRGSRPYCLLTQQSLGGHECDNTSFPPPAFNVGYKMQWSVDKLFSDSMAYIDLSVSGKAEGRAQAQTFQLSFAKSERNYTTP